MRMITACFAPALQRCARCMFARFLVILHEVRKIAKTCSQLHGWHINTAFVERLNLTIRQHIAAVGLRVSTLCKGEDGLRQQVAVFHCYDNFCLPHASRSEEHTSE